MYEIRKNPDALIDGCNGHFNMQNLPGIRVSYFRIISYFAGEFDKQFSKP